MPRDNVRFVRKALFWIAAVPALAAVVTFALNNRNFVSLDLWPFGLAVDAPMFLVLVIALGVGVVLGGVAAWLGGSHTRAALRDADYKAEVLRRELAAEREKAQSLHTKPQPQPAVSAAPVQDVLPPPAA